MIRPNILVIAGHDPSGGAGIQADIESAAANGAHAASVVTLLTCQDTHNVYTAWPVEIDFFAHCLDTLFADMAFAAVKIGVVANTEQIEAVVERLDARPELPLVLDPVLRAAGGGSLAGDTIGLALRKRLFARAALITPNAAEARLLCDGEQALDACGARLSEMGCPALITGGDEGEGDIVNTLYSGGAAIRSDRWPRLPGVFHGSGCTLASAIAARIATGEPLETALYNAQAWTWRTLEQAFSAGRGQAIPSRWPTRSRPAP